MNPVDIDSRVPHYRFQLEEATRKNILALSKREELSTEEDHFILWWKKDTSSVETNPMNDFPPVII